MPGGGRFVGLFCFRALTRRGLRAFGCSFIPGGVFSFCGLALGFLLCMDPRVLGPLYHGSINEKVLSEEKGDILVRLADYKEII